MLANGIHLLPDLSGALWWPAQRLLALADLHPASRMADERLAKLLRSHRPRTVVCLGPGPLPADSAARGRLAAGCDWIWIVGDRGPAGPGGRAVPELAVAGITFRHQPHPDAAPGEIAGHLRPQASATIDGQRMTRPCFVGDGRRLILPAFGAETGGLEVLDPGFRRLFRKGFTVLMLGRERIHTLPRHRLEGAAAARPEQPDHGPPGRRINLFSE